MEQIMEILARMEVKMNASVKEITAEMRPWRKETTTSQEGTEACLESQESTSVQIEFVAVHEEVPKEKAAVKTGRALKKRYGDWHRTVGCCLQSDDQPCKSGMA
jgi:hypothetical protein